MKPRFVPVAWRILADILIAAVSLATAFAVRFTIALFEPDTLSPQRLAGPFISYFVSQGPLLAATLVTCNALFGVYTRTRFYAHRFKAATLFHSVSLAYVLFSFVVYFSGWFGRLVPRREFLLAYALTLAGAMGSLLAKSYFQRRFTVQSTRPTSGRPVHNILVVGGAGYIGSVLVRDLLADGYRVRVLDSLLYGHEPIRDLYGHPEFELVHGDLRNAGPVVKAAKGVDALIHLGAIVGDPACALDEDQTLETNLAATRLLADVCRASGVSRVLFASTCSVYGAADYVVDERSLLNPVSLYAATKIDSERVLLAARDRHFHPAVLRLATAFGWSHRPRFDLVVNLLVAKAVVERKIQIYNGEQWRPFIHVADISRAFRRALTAPIELVSGETYNVGSDSMNFTLRELSEQIARLEPGLAIEYLNNSDVRNYRVSFEKIRGKLGFECRTDLAEGIRGIQDAFVRGLVEDYRDPRYSNVQLLTQRHRQEQGNGHQGNGSIELTALRFAKNSLWCRAIRAGGSGEALFRNGSMGLTGLAKTSSGD
ncbi:MAG: NAD-dependent epimerase/dehydratase family protein [Acidobacteria bacterium]|nr:NAD-dependent epimerase/dehydratase family protein [Acidobacteriota bacterium]